MRPIPTDVTWSVCPLDATMCTTATAELIDRFAVWAMDSSGLKEPHIRRGASILPGKWAILGASPPAAVGLSKFFDHLYRI